MARADSVPCFDGVRRARASCPDPGQDRLELLLKVVQAHCGWGGRGAAGPRRPPAALAAVCLERAIERNSRVMEEARESFAAPLLYHYLARSGLTGATPGRAGTTLTCLRSLYYANAARKTALLKLLEEIADAFAARGIAFLLLKGAALEAALDLPPALRVMADLDLLVPPAALPAAERTLLEMNLTPTRDDTNALLLRRSGYHLVPYATRDGAAVELHREPLPRSVPFRLRAAHLWRDSRTVCWRQRWLRLPSPEHLFLHAAIHTGFWHTRGTALRRLWDLALIAGGMPLDRDCLLTAARDCGAQRLVSRALWELDALHATDSVTFTDLCRRLSSSDDLWSPHSTRDRLRARALLLDHRAQRWALLRYAILPAREETANATGCRSSLDHFRRFLHPCRLWRGARRSLREGQGDR